MHIFLKILILIPALLHVHISHAADFRIGLVTPQNGALEILGRQMREGAQLSLQNSESQAAIMEADDNCSHDSGISAADYLIEENVQIVVGFLCTETLEAALPLLSQAGIPVITPSVRADRITDKRIQNNWLIWRTAPRADAEAEAVSRILLPKWRTEFMAIVDDGTIYGRDLAEKFRLNAEIAGLRPVLIDTFRAEADNQIGLVGRLRRSGATHVFVGGERDDIAKIARDAASLDYKLIVAGGEALRATGEIELLPDVLMIAPAEFNEFNTDKKIDYNFTSHNIIAEGYVIPSYTAMNISIETLELSKTNNSELKNILSNSYYKDIFGENKFNENGDLKKNYYRLLRYDGSKFILVE